MEIKATIKSIITEFREFALKGNMIDLAIGIIIGGAFNKVVQSLVNDVILPPIGFLLNNIDFSNLFFSLNGHHYATMAEAQVAGAPTINYGLFFNSILTFLITAWAVFMLVRSINRLRRTKAEEPTTRDCPFCTKSIPIHARRCPECTSKLDVAGI